MGDCILYAMRSKPLEGRVVMPRELSKGSAKVTQGREQEGAEI